MASLHLWREGARFLAAKFPNVTESSQLSLLWALLAARSGDLGLHRPAERLAGFLAPILKARLTTLWTSEQEYRQEESAIATNRLLRALGCEHDDLTLRPQNEVYCDPAIGYELFCKGETAVAFTLQGWQTAAGAMRLGEVEIPAFGPHAEPLGDPRCFGIGPGDKGWFCAFGAKESWLKIGDVSAGEQGVSFSLQSVGALPWFVFYVRAEVCVVSGRTYKPNTLDRFLGDGDRVLFSRGESIVALSVDRPSKLQIIPLAADGSHWGASFLVAVRLAQIHAEMVFRVAKV